MIYLLDVNALLALAFAYHVHHRRVTEWLQLARTPPNAPVVLASCSITELGFVRIASGGAALAANVAEAKTALLQLKRAERFEFLSDRVSSEYLPHWVNRSAQVTDGHLLQLARSHGAQFATLDTRIPGAELILDEPPGPLAVRDSASLHRSSYEVLQ